MQRLIVYLEPMLYFRLFCLKSFITDFVAVREFLGVNFVKLCLKFRNSGLVTS
jgi:hypothetical protein